MDLNYLYHRTAVSLLRSQAAACDLSRAAHAELAEAYQARIAEWEQSSHRLAA